MASLQIIMMVITMVMLWPEQHPVDMASRESVSWLDVIISVLGLASYVEPFV